MERRDVEVGRLKERKRESAERLILHELIGDRVKKILAGIASENPVLEIHDEVIGEEMKESQAGLVIEGGGRAEEKFVRRGPFHQRRKRFAIVPEFVALPLPLKNKDGVVLGRVLELFGEDLMGPIREGIEITDPVKSQFNRKGRGLIF